MKKKKQSQASTWVYSECKAKQTSPVPWIPIFLPQNSTATSISLQKQNYGSNCSAWKSHTHPLYVTSIFYYLGNYSISVHRQYRESACSFVPSPSLCLSTVLWIEPRCPTTELDPQPTQLWSVLLMHLECYHMWESACLADGQSKVYLRTGGVAQVVERLPSKCEVLSSTPELPGKDKSFCRGT